MSSGKQYNPGPQLSRPPLTSPNTTHPSPTPRASGLTGKHLFALRLIGGSEVEQAVHFSPEGQSCVHTSHSCALPHHTPSGPASTFKEPVSALVTSEESSADSDCVEAEEIRVVGGDEDVDVGPSVLSSIDTVDVTVCPASSFGDFKLQACRFATHTMTILSE